MKKITLHISRFNPETDESPYIQTIENISYEPMETVLDLLLRIRHDMDSSLTFRYSCQCNICGSCAMQINGAARLACGTRISDIAESGVVTVAPLQHFQVIKDLVADIEPLIENLRKITPWIVRDPAIPLPEKEYIIRPDQISETLQKLDRCIICGICHGESDLSLVSMVKSLKFILDPRDSIGEARFRQLAELGLLKYPDECKAVCPKGIDLTQDVVLPLKHTRII